MTPAQALEYTLAHTDRKPVTLAPTPVSRAPVLIIKGVNTNKDLH